MSITSIVGRDYDEEEREDFWDLEIVMYLHIKATAISVKEARETENVTIAIMTRKLKKGEDYIYVD